jgi:hypothetical protein
VSPRLHTACHCPACILLHHHAPLAGQASNWRMQARSACCLCALGSEFENFRNSCNHLSVSQTGVLCLARTVRRAKWRQTSLPGPNVLHLQQALRRHSGVSTCPFGNGPPPRCVVLCVPRPKLFYLSTPSHVASLHATLHRFGRRIALLHSSTTHTHTGGGPQVSNGSEHNRLPQSLFVRPIGCWSALLQVRCQRKASEVIIKGSACPISVVLTGSVPPPPPFTLTTAAATDRFFSHPHRLLKAAATGAAPFGAAIPTACPFTFLQVPSTLLSSLQLHRFARYDCIDTTHTTGVAAPLLSRPPTLDFCVR